MDPNTPQPTAQQAPYYPESGGGMFASKKRIFLMLFILLSVVAIIVATIWFFFLRGASSSTDEPVTLTYWGVWEDEVVMQPVLEQFMSENPTITVEYEKMDIKALGDYVDRVRTRINEGTGPDVMRYHSSWLTQMNELLLPFPSDVVESTGLGTDFFTVVQRDLTRDGAYYGLPLSIDTLALYINTDLFSNIGATPPTDWFDFNQVAVDLISPDEQGEILSTGAALGTYDNIAHAPDIMALMFIQNSADMRALASEESLERSVNALEYYTRFADNGSASTWNASFDNSKIVFAGERLAMYFGYSWDMFEINAANPDLNYVVIPVPELFGKGTTVASYWAEGVSAKSKNPEAAFKLIQFLGKDETLQQIFEAQAKVRGIGSPYPKRTLAANLQDDDRLSAFVARADDAVSTFFSSDTYDAGLNAEMNTYLGNAIRSVINDNTSVESAITTLASGVSQVLTRYE